MSDELIPDALSPEGAAPIEGQPEVLSPAEPTPDPEPQPEGYRFKVRDEEGTLPRDAVDSIAERMGWRPDDVPRYLGIGRKRDRQEEERSKSLAAREAQLSREIEELRTFRQAAQGFDPNQLDPQSRFLLQRLDNLESGMKEQVGGLLSRLEAKEQEAEWAEEVNDRCEQINAWAEENGFPTFDGTKFLREMIRTGLASSEMDWGTACFLNYQGMAFREMSRNGQKNGNGKAPPRTVSTQPRPRPQQSFAVPAASQNPVAPRDDTKPVPGETREQAQERRKRALAGMTINQIVGPQDA